MGQAGSECRFSFKPIAGRTDAERAEVGLRSGLAMQRRLLTEKLLCYGLVQAKTKLDADLGQAHRGDRSQGRGVLEAEL